MSKRRQSQDRVKTCLLCHHFHLNAGDRGYSEMTPGYDFSMECEKKVWEWDQFDTDEDAFRKMLTTAEGCKYYLYHREAFRKDYQ